MITNTRKPISFTRIPFTLCLITVLLAVAIYHGVWDGPLLAEFKARFGIAPQHLIEIEWLRIFSSLLFTTDFYHLRAAIIMSLLCVGWLEYQSGSVRAALTFVLSHSVTIAMASLFFLICHRYIDDELTNTLRLSTDVGPSAGYYGCLGAALAGASFQSQRRINMLFIAIISWLTVRFLISVGLKNVDTIQSDLAHLVALFVGAIPGYVGRIRRTESSSLGNMSPE